VLLADGVVVEEGPPEKTLDAPESERARSFLSKLRADSRDTGTSKNSSEDRNS